MIVAIVQARMGSTRLPGKVMFDLTGKPVLCRVVERVRAAKSIDEAIVATSTNAEDDAIEEFCEKSHIVVYRGSSEDVLARYYEAARKVGAETIIRITSDCPLIDPSVIDQCIAAYRAGGFDYISNCTNGERTFPRGLDVEVFSFAALERAYREAKAAAEREHVTPFIWKNAGIFKLGPALKAAPHYNRPQYRLTLDYKEDYELLSKLYGDLYKEGELVSVREVIRYLDAHSEIVAINAASAQKEV